MVNERPLVFVDLDDTLFQTARKMPVGSPRVGVTQDVNGQPNGFMSPMQEAFFAWLSDSADLVPVTARSIEAYSRVRLPFVFGAICSHGGAMLGPDGQYDRDWHAQMEATLLPYRERLPQLSETTLAIGQELGHSLRGWVVEEQDLRHYVVTKHNESDDSGLSKVLAEMQRRNLLDGLHIHANGNNLAFLPNGLAKRLAVQEWLRRDRARHGERPVLGFGDSVTDLGFMSECHFWATPSHGQLAKAVEGLLDD